MANIKVITFSESTNTNSPTTATHYTCPADTIAKILPQWVRGECGNGSGSQFAGVEVGGFRMFTFTTTSSSIQGITLVRSNGGISGYADEFYCLPGETIQSVLQGHSSYTASAMGKFLIIEEPQGT
jgi:hypothetical protein